MLVGVDNMLVVVSLLVGGGCIVWLDIDIDILIVVIIVDLLCE